jgi:hypothetical protein
MERSHVSKAAWRLLPVAVLALTGILAGATSAGAAPPPVHPASTYVCSGGVIPSGTYASILVTGNCYTPSGTVEVRGDLTVAPGALLDAATPGDPAGAPVVPATVLIGGSVWVGRGAVLIFGCSPNIFCGNPPGVSYDRIAGSLDAVGALGVVVHSAAIGGNVSIVGGGGGVNCDATPATLPASGAPAPWSDDASLDYTPVYTDFEDNSIGGGLTIADLESCWLGTLRNQVQGSVSLVHNTMADPDAMEVASNLVGGALTCASNSAGGVPTVQYGDSSGSPNMVAGWAGGQCGFGLQVLNPAADAGPGGILEDISVPTWTMGEYHGTRTQIGPTVETLQLGVTASGDTLVAQLNNVRFAGSGLEGILTVDLDQPPGATGEAVLSTVRPDGSVSFTAFETCAVCSFQGHHGSVALRVYGTISTGGVITGTFLVASGGAGNGDLSTLAGYGTFSSVGEPEGTLATVSHLEITGPAAPGPGPQLSPWQRSGPRRR